jgi:predicted transcriptional regulator with HTH domain
MTKTVDGEIIYALRRNVIQQVLIILPEMSYLSDISMPRGLIKSEL